MLRGWINYFNEADGRHYTGPRLYIFPRWFPLAFALGWNWYGERLEISFFRPKRYHRPNRFLDPSYYLYIRRWSREIDLDG